MTDARTTDLAAAIERAALDAFCELLAPDLARTAAAAFAEESAATIERRLDEVAGALREQIEGQLSTLPGAKRKDPGAKEKRVVKRPAKKDDAAPAPAEG
jgi:hypothetical protein